MHKFFNFWLLITLVLFVAVLSLSFKFKANNNSIEVYSKNKIHVISDEMLDSYINISRELASYDKFDQAIAIIDKVIIYKPGYDNIYSLLSNIYLAKAFYVSKNNLDKVKDSPEFKKALELGNINIKSFSRLSESYEGLIDTYLSIKDYTTAIKVSKEACLANPNSKTRCKQVADLYLETGDIKNAVSFYKSLLNNHEITDKSWIYKKLGAIYSANGDCLNSQKYFNLSYKTDNTNESLDNTLNTCYLNN